MDEIQAGQEQVASVAQEAQKMIPQDEMNKIIGREKMKAADNARREVEQKYQQELESLRMQQQQRNEQVPRDTDANAIYQQVQEMMNLQRQKDEAQQIANTYHAKIEQGKSAYSDFDDVTKLFKPEEFPQVAVLLAGLPNAADVLYELANNPTKLGQIDYMANRNPRMAQSELLKLSQSINANKQAQADAQNQNVAAPLDRLAPSRVAGSNGKPTISDLRNQSWLRG